MKPQRHHAQPDVSESEVIPSDLESEFIERSELIAEIKETADKFARDEATIGDLKIVSRALRELRYAFKVFKPFRRQRKVSIFGSARTEPDDPTYQLTERFAQLIVNEGWYVVTGAGPGIMEAGHKGAGREHSMGLNIILPFEAVANPYIINDPKLVHLKYFFTRKLLFVKEVHAIALFAGGFGTMDEVMEVLTLVQTGKRDLMPIVFVQTPGETYWDDLSDFFEKNMLRRGMIAPEDMSLFKIFQDPADAVEEIMRFYCVYHSMRYVHQKLVIRLHKEVPDDLLAELNEQFADILESGKIERVEADPSEFNDEHLVEFPRLRLHFNRRDMGKLRLMIDLINERLGS